MSSEVMISRVTVRKGKIKKSGGEKEFSIRVVEREIKYQELKL